MRSWNRRFLALVFAIAPVLLAWADPVAAGRKALDFLLSRNFGAFNGLLTGAAKERLNEAFLRDRVGTELEGFGKMESVGKPLTAKSGSDTLVSFPVQFEKVTVNVQFTVNDAGNVAALFFRPADSPLPPQWKRPAYSKPELFREREVTVGAGEWKLPGTLTSPVGRGPFATVVLVHGPGPNDRDETLYSNHIFRDIAEGLASRGIAVLRYDKRTKVYGEKMSEGSYTLQQETVDDAVAALASAGQQKVFVLGHSLGGYAIPRIASRFPKLAGAVFLAANARPIEDVVLDQNERMLNIQRADPASQRRLDALRAEVAKVKALNANSPPIVLGLPSAYLLDLKNYDAANEAKRFTFPMLFLQGERDLQISSKDFEAWKSALGGRKNVTFRMFPLLNHLFIAGDGEPSTAEYRVPGNVSVQVIDAISAWLKQQ